ncbi:MAG: dihydrolipoamide acetyltransferase family protein [Candidatus Glassbacteria bacterium]
MAFNFVLPDLGEGITEGEVIKWHVQVGDYIEEDQVLLEVETDKAAVEIPSPKSGYILEINANEGDIIHVGETLVVIGEKEESKGKPAPAEEKRLAREKEQAQAEAAAQAKSAGVEERERPQAHTGGEVLATPSTRKLARELGVDLTGVTGTGKGGRITTQDVRKAAEALNVPVKEAPAEIEERIPVRSLRRKTAAKMVEAYTTIPHVTHVEEVDVKNLVRLREQMNEALKEEGYKLTYLPFILKALVPALKLYPQFNAVFDEKAEEIILKKYYNIGIATATDAGLMVPVVKGVDEKSISQLSREIERLTEEARTRKIALADLRNGTFSVTNYGSIGGLFGTPIINHPEVAILGVGRMQKRPVVIGEEITVSYVLYLSLSFDHRITDGKEAAEFVNVVKKYLEEPNLLFLEMA